MPEKGVILYLGRFEMPDKDATANRVLSNGKLLRELEYKVVFIGWNPALPWNKGIGERPVIYNDFECWELARPKGMNEQFFTLTDSSRVNQIINKYNNIKILIAYNYPAVALRKIYHLCRRRGIKCIADITEWYGIGTKSVLIKTIRAFDTAYRMKVIQKKLDGHIVISEFLHKYYAPCHKKAIILPPLVDLSDRKWLIGKKSSHGLRPLTIIYAGKPCSVKERLDLFIKALLSVRKHIDIRFRIVGITKKEFFKEIYPSLNSNNYAEIEDVVTFCGQVSHKEALRYVKEADYSLVIREKNRTTQAGFPTKFVESISCGTPVLTTDNSDVKTYIIEGKNGYIISLDSIETKLFEIAKHEVCDAFDRTIFDYHHYIERTEKFINSVLSPIDY